MLIDRLKPEIRNKCREQLSKGIVLLHDNARLHTAAHTVETLQKLKFEVLAHPPYGPYLDPSGYYLFGPLKKALRGCRFTFETKNWRKRFMRGSLLSQKLPPPPGP